MSRPSGLHRFWCKRSSPKSVRSIANSFDHPTGRTECESRAGNWRITATCSRRAELSWTTTPTRCAPIRKCANATWAEVSREFGILSASKISRISKVFPDGQLRGVHSERRAVGHAVCGAQSKNPVEPPPTFDRARAGLVRIFPPCTSVNRGKRYRESLVIPRGLQLRSRAAASPPRELRSG